MQNRNGNGPIAFVDEAPYDDSVEVIEHKSRDARMQFATAWILITGRQMPWPFRVCGITFKGV